MKVKLNLSLILVVFCTLLAFKVGEQVELTDFLNARRTPNFITKKNVVRTLTMGTTGEIKQIKKFHSGNMGFKIELNSGPLRGQSYWVYYNVKDPAIKVTSKKTKKEIPKEEITEETANGAQKPDAELEDDHEGIEDPEDTELKAHAKFLQDPQNALDKISSVLIPCENQGEVFSETSLLQNYPQNSLDYVCGNASEAEVAEKCGLSVSTSGGKSSDDVDVLDIDLNSNQVIKHSKLLTEGLGKENLKFFEMVNSKRRPSRPIGFPVCSTKMTGVEDFELCRNHQTVENFLVRNSGPNAMVDKKDGLTSRVFNFRTEDNALSDAHLEINDIRMSNSGTNDAKIYRLMFFPRSQLPSAKLLADKIELTLPNKEKVLFDKKTKQIIGGVLSEKKLNTNFSQSLNENSVNYTGTGVVIKLDVVKAGKAIITKGSATCKVDSADLWYEDAKTKRTIFKEQYATDEGLNKYIQKECGFGM